MLLDIATVHD